MKNFNILVWNSKTKDFENCIFLCKSIKHKSLTKYAGTQTYWYSGREGKNWYRGGFYNQDFGFINANVLKYLNVEGIVYEGVVYELVEVTLIDKI